MGHVAISMVGKTVRVKLLIIIEAKKRILKLSFLIAAVGRGKGKFH